jgi:hypothetical protein
MADAADWAPWALTAQQTLSTLGVDAKQGIKDEQVSQLRGKHGWNELEKAPKQSIWAMIVEQFEDTLVRVGAAGRQQFHSGALPRFLYARLHGCADTRNAACLSYGERHICAAFPSYRFSCSRR